MVLRLRGSMRTVSAVLVLLSLWSLPHRSLPDICLPAGLLEHDESKHVVTGVPSSGGDEDHCAVCHWMRSLKPVFAPAPHHASDTAARSAVFLVTHVSPAQAALTRIPARAPPSSL